MNEYSYIGVAESLRFGFGEGVKFIVRAKGHSIRKGHIVKFAADKATVYAEVLNAAYMRIGCEEEEMLSEFGKIYDVDKIYSLDWEKEEKKDA